MTHPEGHPEAPHVQNSRPTVEVTAGARPAGDFIDGEPPTAPVEFPPVGAYPDEPGHPDSDGPEPDPQPRDNQPRDNQPPDAAFPDARLPDAGHPDTQLIAPVHDETTAPAASWPQPWHAQHERPGEWQTHPPEHLAWEHSPPPIFQEQPPPVGPPPPPWQVQLAPPAESRRSRSGLWVSLALTAILLLCGGGAVSAYFLVSNADTGKGAPDPATAVNRFMTAVYAQQDATTAETLVCRQARDAAALRARVTQIKDMSRQYENLTFRWDDPAVSDQTDDHATVTVALTLTTDDEKTAAQTLTFTTVHKTGWLVCDISG